MTDTTTKIPKARPVSFLPEELQRVIAEAVAAATAQAKAEFAEALAAKPSAASNGKSQASMQNEIAVVKAFKKAGFGNVTPHEDVRTFNRWLSAGYRPVEGSKSLKIKNLRLFHRSQVRELTIEEKAGLQAENESAVARHSSSVIPITGANPH